MKNANSPGLWLYSLVIFVAASAVVLAQKDTPLRISGGGVTLSVAPDGRVSGSAAIGAFTLRAEPVGCKALNAAKVNQAGAGAVEIVRLFQGPQGQPCRVTQRLAQTTDSMRWTVAVEADGEPWTTPIGMGLTLANPKGMQFWCPALGSLKAQWKDPLQAIPFGQGRWMYGIARGMSLPLATVYRQDKDAGLSLVCSPEDLLLDLALGTAPSGLINFAHSQHRLGKNRRVSFTMDLVAHAADWRCGLGWMTQRYPKFFDPPQPAVEAVSGCAAYSALDDLPDVEKMKKMAFRANWRAVFDWPYLGLNLPPVERADQPWVCADPYNRGYDTTMTINRLNGYGRKMKQAGFHALNYFTTTEFGLNLKGPAAVKKDLSEKDLWQDCTSLLYRKLRDSILLNDKGQPQMSWHGCIAMDCGGASWRAFILDQARRHVACLPDFSGICIDRLDWLTRVNTHADDGVGLYQGRPGRLVRLSWLSLMAELAPIIHKGGQVILANPCQTYRLEAAQYLDGIYDEFGDYGPNLNGSALLCLRKPLLAWTRTRATLGNDPDLYFQRLLLLGAFPTAPYPKNNHTINPDPWSDKQYLAYGPLLDAMRGKKWVLAPHCIEAGDGKAKVNLFEVPGGWVAPVTFGGEAKNVKVLIRNVAGLSAKLTIDALHPGMEQSQPVASRQQGDALELTVPLHRGCAMVRLR